MTTAQEQYNSIVEGILERTTAEGAILIVIGNDEHSNEAGLAMAIKDEELAKHLPKILRFYADKIQEDPGGWKK